MQLHTLKRKTARKSKKLVGRGGTRGKTAGRGTKGQNARAGHKKRPELRDFIKRFPKLRGRGISPFKSIVKKNVPINLSRLNSAFKAGDVINATLLKEKRMIKAGERAKILGTGEVDKKFIIEKVIISLGAAEKILKAGGQIR